MKDSIEHVRYSRQRIVQGTIVGLETLMVAILLALWLTVESIQESKNLWVLFFYHFPSQFLIAIVPQEPVLFYFAKFYTPLTVAWVATAGTVVTEYLNYSIFNFFTDFSPVQKVKQWSVVSKLLTFFNKVPFISLWVAGVSPIPFYPFRFLAVLSEYPRWKYLTAVLTARFPRFLLYSWIGKMLRLPDWLLMVIFIAISLLIYLPLIQKGRKKRKQTRAPTSGL